MKYAPIILALLTAPALAGDIPAALMRPPGRVNVLPPPQYDKPYTGKLTIETVATPEQVMIACNLKKPALACAFPYDGTRCRIVIVPESYILATGYTREIVLRHESGHCNGWAINHPDSRPL